MHIALFVHLLFTGATLAAAGTDEAKDPDVAAREQLHLGTAIHGALDLPTTVSEQPSTTEAPLAALALKRMTVDIRNHHGAPIRTVHTGEKAVGNPGSGIIGAGKTGRFVVNPGWHGTVAINDAKFSATTGDESLIEGSYVNQGRGFAQGDVNISFVDGFSVPIVCWCNANNILTGCNKKLFELHRCGNPNGQGSCKNPNRNNRNVKSATPFFRPCHAPGGAYTFPSDDRANNLNAKCPQEKYTCCVGHRCRANP